MHCEEKLKLRSAKLFIAALTEFTE